MQRLAPPLTTLLFLAGLALYGALSGCAARAAPVQAPRSLDDQTNAAVGIEISCGGVLVGYGSGVIVSPTHVLTAAHVAMDGCTFVVETRRGDRVAMFAEAVAPRADVARLEVVGFETFDTTPPEVGPVPAAGEEVCVVVVLPSRWHRCGEVQLGRSADGAFRHTAITEHGNSGSGVYDRRGRLVGIVVTLSQASNGQITGGGAEPISEVPWIVPVRP